MPDTHSERQDTLFLDLPVEIESIEQARLALSDYLKPRALSDIETSRIEVVLEELLSNVVRHSGDVRMLTLEAQWQKGMLRLTVEDDGPAFNPFDAPPPREFVSVEGAQLGGQGIVLVRKLSRDVGYERCGGINRISALLAA